MKLGWLLIGSVLALSAAPSLAGAATPLLPVDQDATFFWCGNADLIIVTASDTDATADGNFIAHVPSGALERLPEGVEGLPFACSPDGGAVLYAEGTAVRLLDRDTGEERALSNGYGSYAFSPDRKWILLGELEVNGAETDHVFLPDVLDAEPVILRRKDLPVAGAHIIGLDWLPDIAHAVLVYSDHPFGQGQNRLAIADFDAAEGKLDNIRTVQQDGVGDWKVTSTGHLLIDSGTRWERCRFQEEALMCEIAPAQPFEGVGAVTPEDVQDEERYDPLVPLPGGDGYLLPASTEEGTCLGMKSAAGEVSCLAGNFDPLQSPYADLQLSPDGRWVAYRGRITPDRGEEGIFVVAVPG